VRNWVMSAEVADAFAAWDNRVLLAGDAAHRCVLRSLAGAWAGAVHCHVADFTGAHMAAWPAPGATQPLTATGSRPLAALA
jgi:hypothetical protein